MEKIEKYELLVSQVRALIEGETDAVAVMSNVAAAIHHTMGFWWTGFYRVVSDELLLGPFQGPVACMHIPFGKGVCGTAWKQAETIIVPDVEQFPGHIACSSESKSEIVVPVFGSNKTVVAVLDIDSEKLNTFDETDRKYLEEICKMIRQWRQLEIAELTGKQHKDVLKAIRNMEPAWKNVCGRNFALT